MKDLFFRLRNARLAVRLGSLLVAVLCVYAVVAPIAGRLEGGLGVVATTIAAGLCLAGAGIALVAANGPQTPDRVLRGMLIGMIARMIIPLGLGVGLYFYSQPLAEAGLLVYLLAFYPVTLGVETALALPGGALALPGGDGAEPCEKGGQAPSGKGFPCNGG